jgi:hypothetical protein
MWQPFRHVEMRHHWHRSNWWFALTLLRRTKQKRFLNSKDENPRLGCSQGLGIDATPVGRIKA